jgi:transposase
MQDVAQVTIHSQPSYGGIARFGVIEYHRSMSRRFTAREVKELVAAAVAPLHAKIVQLVARIAQLETENARLKKDSSTSSKPPSSDIVKPPLPPLPGGKGKKRRRGGQPNHPRHVRPPFPPEQIDRTEIHELSGLGPDWEPLDEFRPLQQVELVKKLFEVTEHLARYYRNRRTGEAIAAPFPDEVAKGGLVGMRLAALIGYTKGACHMSYHCLERFLDDVLGLKLSRGYLVKVVQKMSAALAPGYQALRDLLPRQPMLNIDGTGHPENGKQFNVWGFHAPGKEGFTFFHIDPSKSADILKQFLGDAFAGVVGCDYAGEYRRFAAETDAVLQFCWAHLIRDVKYLITLPDAATRRFGEKLLEKTKVLFRVWHRRETMPPVRWQQEVARIRQEILQVVRRPPLRTEAMNLSQRFRDHGPYYFTFLDRPGVEPTNNAIEQQFRHLIIDRKVTQGTRGEAGRRWCERIWTTLATCAQRGQSAFVYLSRTIEAFFRGQTGPVLLALPP